MIFVKNSRGGREVNMINTVSKINLSEIGWEGGGSTSIWIMSLNIQPFLFMNPSSLNLFFVDFSQICQPYTVASDAANFISQNY